MNALYSPSSHQFANTIISFFPKIIQLDTLLDQAIQSQDQESLLGTFSALAVFCFSGLLLQHFQLQQFSVLAVFCFSVFYFTKAALAYVCILNIGISKIICGLGENHCRLVLSKIDHGGMDIIRLILKVTQMPLQYPTEESCSPVSFSF